MKDEVTIKHKIIYEEIANALSKIAKKNGLEIPCSIAQSSSDVLLLNVSVYTEKAESIYASWFIKNHEKVDLEKHWLNSSFTNPKSGRSLKILGLDVDGGNKCVIVQDNDTNELFHMCPSTVKHLMVNPEVIE